jgi:hypothetical protein
MIHRTIKSETGIKWRIYKFFNNEEYNTFLHDTEKYYKASTTILSSGLFRTSDMNFLKSLADDLAYQDLDLTSFDLFIITKENISLKIADEEKKQRLIKRASTQIDKVSKSTWTPEELGFIWTDTVENVAKRLNKTKGSVKLQRNIFLSENAGFIIPEVAKNKSSKKEKVEKVKKEVKSNEWTAEETALLWSKPAMILSQEIRKNIREIAKKRVEWCMTNPNFIIPYVAQFSSKGLSNKVERKKRINGWTEEQECLLWEDTIENLSDILGKSKQSVYMKRQKFLQRNPKFTIPDCAKTVKNTIKSIEHPIQEIKKANNVLAPTLFDKAIDKATSVERKKRPYNKKQKKENTSMKEVADFLNQLSKMPKKIKMNGIELEFLTS